MRKSFQKPSPAALVSNVGAKCQKCLKEGHWTADCTYERVYKSRPSRTALLLNPKLKLPEASLIKNDFVDERKLNKKEYETLEDQEERSEIQNADVFADQLIEEVKMNHFIKESKSLNETNNYSTKTEHDLENNGRRKESHSTVRSRSLSRSRSRSPQERPRRYRSRTPERIHIKNEKNNKYSEYASDSDFSSDSD